ncbi:unnamed protein product [Caenorhabditis nigoni]
MSQNQCAVSELSAAETNQQAVEEAQAQIVDRNKQKAEMIAFLLADCISLLPLLPEAYGELAKYLMEFVLEMLENHQTREVHEGQEEVVLADPRDVEYLNELGIDNQENQNGQQIDHQEEDEMGNENDENEIDTPEEPLEDTELHDQMEERDCQSTRNPVEAPTKWGKGKKLTKRTDSGNGDIYF